MNCGCPPQNNQVNIFKGQDKTFQVNLFYTDTGQPFDLTAASAIKAYFPGSVASVIKTLGSGVTVVGAAGAGLIQIVLSAADTALLLVNPSGPQFQDLQIKATVGAVTTTFVIQACLNIQAQEYLDP